MDFDKAVGRLARDQSQLRKKRGGAGPISAKAQREAALRRKQQERLATERSKRKEQADETT